MTEITDLILFIGLSIPVIVLSWKSLFNLKTHGFYRFFSWECIVLLFSINYKYWFIDPFKTSHAISWLLLCISLYLIIAGTLQLRKHGKSDSHRKEQELYTFEKTTNLVDTGIYKYIRHPLYSSLLFLTWGICLKNINSIVISISCISSLFLYLTAMQDEKNCILYFGKDYSEYMTRTKRFIPLLF